MLGSGPAQVTVTRPSKPLPRRALLRVVAAASAGLAALGWAPARGQEPQGPLSVRVVAVRGAGQLEPGKAPEIPAALRPWREALAELGHARYEALSSAARRGPVGRPLAFELPLEHALEATASRHGERIGLRCEVTRPARTPPPAPPRRERVVAVDVQLDDGAHYVLRVVKAWPEADLLLIVTASSRALE